ncbi:Osmotin thaumatin-like protein [Cantharellus anzutake]|uniref:Osmotin thaumatin-like protein n=1 Tax=Cantharellus anzutake TaxID=1750568 RepID=UPI001907EEDF|nr:Osmotin thaumatin-like protein [Cantharellus anzutake]KAF8327576.1 Osmotin thaumatin-like protein [Cantharellus anzutake]
MKLLAVAALLACIASTSAITITFNNKCSYTVWPAIGKAPNGQPDPSVSFGTTLDPGGEASFSISDYEIGIRAWGRTGCDHDGANCETGSCEGGLVCTDAGITSDVLLSEYGYGDFGRWGGKRTSWDLARSNNVNIPTRLDSSDGQSVTCLDMSCPDNQAYSYSTDYAADRNSPLGQTYTHVFCP